MRLTKVTEDAQHLGVFNFHPLGDLHVGAKDCDIEALQERIDLIRRDPFSRWGGLGDYGEFITDSDTRRYRRSDIPERLWAATDIKEGTIEWVVELLEPIADKCWFFGEGNHEDELDAHHGGVKTAAEIAVRLGLQKRYVGYEGYINVQFKVGARGAMLGQNIYFHHGKVNGQEAAFLAKARDDMAVWPDSDIIVGGHNHKPIVKTYPAFRIRSKGSQPVREDRTVINGGSWKSNFSDHGEINPRKKSQIGGDLWSERKGLRRERVGGPVLQLNFDQGYSATTKNGHRCRPASITHTGIEGAITARVLGLPS